MEQQEEGRCIVGHKHVCPNCISDYAIQNFIKHNVAEKTCSYCEDEAERNIAAPMKDVIQFIAEGLNAEYEDPGNEVHFESADGGYDLRLTDTRDLLSYLELGDSHPDVFEDLCDEFCDHEWVHRDPYGDLECDALRYNWEAFAKQVKHRTRFVFFRLTTADKEAREPEPHEILISLHRIVNEVGLVRTLDPATRFYRAQLPKPGECLAGAGAKRLGTPLPESASHGRMSPAGIPMLYVAQDAQTAEAEKVSTYPATVTTAEFTNLRPLRILDLSQIPDVPSLFDERKRHQRMPLIFLRNFAKEISKPISDDESPYEYVPTQVMTEYFRHLFHLPSKKNPIPVAALDGIAFRSSKNDGGINYTLFIDQAACADHDTDKGAVMLLQGKEQRTISKKPESLVEALRHVVDKNMPITMAPNTRN